MTPLKQFADSVTGSTLPKQFKAIRIKLTIAVFVLLSLLLVLSGFNVTETTRIGFDKFRNDIRSDLESAGYIVVTPGRQANKPEPGPLKRELDVRRLDNFQDIQRAILRNNIILIIVLTSLTWIALYYLLLPLAQAVEEREKFITLASHELRTPLAILHSELSLSEDETSLEEIKKVHKEALQEIKRLQHLSNTLLTKDADFLPVSLEVKDVVQSIINSLSLINSKHITFNTEVDSMILLTDKTRAYQLLYNIMENAMKYSTPKGTVTIETDQISKQIIISNPSHVSDFVPGIGIQACRELANQLNYGISFGLNDGVFKVIIKIR